MRPKNLKFPFSWEERKPYVFDQILIVPSHYDLHHEWTDEEGLFSGDRPLFLEYCSGNGDWIIQKAIDHPEITWIAVEKQFERVRKIWSKRENNQVKNLLIVSGKAEEFTRYYLPSESIQEVFVNFPDPWPKERHAKHRLIQAPFVDQMARVVRPTGKATFATDDPPYASQMIEEMGNHKDWEYAFPKPHYKESLDNYGSSWFQNLWQEKGRGFHYIQCTKK